MMAVRFRVTGVSFRENDDREIEVVELNFTTTDPENLVYANGRIPIGVEEYFQANSLTAMADIVKEKFIERLTETEEAAEESTEE